MRSDCEFSTGNVARSDFEIGTNAQHFRSLPFREIYHRGPLPTDHERRDAIINARHAEALYKSELDLEDLRDIVCRTGPERETLLALLGHSLAPVWKDRIRLEHANEGLFERRWYYVRDIRLIDRKVHVRMSRVPSGVDQQLLVKYEDGGQVTVRPQSVTGTNVVYRIPRTGSKIGAQITVIDSMAFRGVLAEQALFGG